MKILITGNMGYVGPSVVKTLRQEFPGSILVGYDMGYFAHILTSVHSLPERYLDVQHFGDVRVFPKELLSGVDAVVHLAALSNDPLGDNYAGMTHEVNCLSSLRLAEIAREAGVSSFVFASSCSTYGLADDQERCELSKVNPLTAYARSKVDTEIGLEKLAGDEFKVTCLRFATACGMSDRLRLDLVLNDFVASAITSRKISILSDGCPWRPLIHIDDMARGIAWAIARDVGHGGDYLVVNVGSNSWNFQVRDLAFAVQETIPGIEVTTNKNAQPDRRSYRVSFDLFKKLAPAHQPVWDLRRTILDLKEGLDAIGFRDAGFRDSRFMRLKALEELQQRGEIDPELSWLAQRAAGSAGSNS